MGGINGIRYPSTHGQVNSVGQMSQISRRQFRKRARRTGRHKLEPRKMEGGGISWIRWSTVPSKVSGAEFLIQREDSYLPARTSALKSALSNGVRTGPRRNCGISRPGCLIGRAFLGQAVQL